MDGLSIVGLVVGSALVGLSNILIVWSLRRRSAGLHEGYCDEDGEATELSIKALGGRWPRRCIFALSVLGLACTSATAVLSTLEPSLSKEEVAVDWCQFVGWVGSLYLLVV